SRRIRSRRSSGPCRLRLRRHWSATVAGREWSRRGARRAESPPRTSCSSTAPSLRSACVASLLTPRRAHRRDVRADDLPAEIGEAYPRLALTTDRVLAAHLELEVHGGQGTAEREDFEPDPLLFGTRPRRPRHAVGVDLREAVAVLLERVA